MHIDLTVGFLSNITIMSNNDYSNAKVLISFFKKLENFQAGFGVNIASRFVSQNDLGVHDESSDHSGSLLLATGDFVGIEVASVVDLEFF